MMVLTAMIVSLVIHAAVVAVAVVVAMVPVANRVMSPAMKNLVLIVNQMMKLPLPVLSQNQLTVQLLCPFLSPVQAQQRYPKIQFKCQQNHSLNWISPKRCQVRFPILL